MPTDPHPTAHEPMRPVFPVSASQDPGVEGVPGPYDRVTAASMAAMRGPIEDDISRQEAADDRPERAAFREQRDAAIREFASRWADHPDSKLVEDMIRTVCKLAEDNATRLSMKILAGAMKELRYAYNVFQPYLGNKKCTIFGSARTPEDRADYRAAVEFSRRISEQGWMVITGAGDGIMKAGHEGAGTSKSFGVSIRLPFETNANEFIEGDPKLVNFRYFFTRKLMFLKESDAVVLFPGGFGTHDELFETLTLVQTGKNQPMPIVCVDAPGGTYWSKWYEYVKDEFLGNGLISPEDFALFKVTDDIDFAVHEVTHFYDRYHSTRYVERGHLLLIRMKSRLSPEHLARINRDFASLCKTGTIEQRPGPHPGEAGELPGLPRLSLHFNKRDYGKLRLLIDALNG